MSAINVGGRLDRLPLTRLHRKVFYLVGVGMFFEGFDIYIAASVLGATYKTGFSTLAENGLFISITFVGMTLGALLTGFLGDRYGRRFTYQVNLLIFGAAALASVFVPDMRTLIALRFLMGLGLGAEVVVGYSIMAEFFPARIRGRWSGMISTIVTAAWLLRNQTSKPHFGAAKIHQGPNRTTSIDRCCSALPHKSSVDHQPWPQLMFLF